MRFLVLAVLAILVMASRRHLARYRVSGMHRPGAAVMRDFEWGTALRDMGAWRREATI